MKLKKIVTLVSSAILAFSLVGCSIEGEESSAGSDGAVVGNGSIGFSVSTLNNPFFVTLSQGAKDKAKEEGRDLIVVDAGDDAAKQTSDIEDLISKNISILIVNPVDSDAVAPAVKDAVGKDAKVVELEGTSGSSATIDRGTGFHKVADEQLNVVSSQTANFNRSEGMTVMENMLQSNSDIKGVFAHNDEMALGAVEAIGNKDIVVVGFDSTDDALAAIKKGKMAATVAQKPDLMGATAVETAIKIINGEAVEKSIPVEVELVTK